MDVRVCLHASARYPNPLGVRGGGTANPGHPAYWGRKGGADPGTLAHIYIYIYIYTH